MSMQELWKWPDLSSKEIKNNTSNKTRNCCKRVCVKGSFDLDLQWYWKMKILQKNGNLIVEESSHAAKVY